MATPKTLILGNPGAILQPDSYRQDPYRGNWQTRKWRGPKAKIIQTMLQLAGTGIAFEVNSVSGATWEITATASFTWDGATEQSVPIWEVHSNIIGKSILNSPACAGISTADLLSITNWLANQSQPLPSVSAGAATTVLGLIQRGVTTYETSQPIVRFTQVTSNTYAVITSAAGVGLIYSTGNIGAPGTLLVGLPASGAGSSGIPGGSNFGWRKKPVQVQTASYAKFQVIQEWEFGEWSTFLYGGLN